jgi:hypothetical protein
MTKDIALGIRDQGDSETLAAFARSVNASHMGEWVPLGYYGSSPKRVGNFARFFQLEIYIRGFSEA